MIGNGAGKLIICMGNISSLGFDLKLAAAAKQDSGGLSLLNAISHQPDQSNGHVLTRGALKDNYF